MPWLSWLVMRLRLLGVAAVSDREVVFDVPDGFVKAYSEEVEGLVGARHLDMESGDFDSVLDSRGFIKGIRAGLELCLRLSGRGGGSRMESSGVRVRV